MSGRVERPRHRLAEVRLDEATIPSGQSDRDHERKIAIFDLIEDSRFGVRNRDDGPYCLTIARSETRLTFDVRGADGAPVVEFAVSMSPFRPLLKDYFFVCESYYSAIRSASPSEIVAIDRERTALHNEGAELIAARMADKVEIDAATARRLFTLIFALHWKV